MYIAIDDTYGGSDKDLSKYVTNSRRTHVGVIFNDDDVESIRYQVRAWLKQASKVIGVDLCEFHFVDIYNRYGDWSSVNNGFNLFIFKLFADIYTLYRWEVVVQTIDDRTFNDHPEEKKIITDIANSGKLAGFDFSKREDISLFWVMTKIKKRFPPTEDVNIYIDEGIRKSGGSIGSEIFNDRKFKSEFVSSKDEPLIQIADFMAFSLNRVTNLSMKEKRSDVDNWFIRTIGGMPLNSPDVSFMAVKKDFNKDHFDMAHKADRISKGLEKSSN